MYVKFEKRKDYLIVSLAGELDHHSAEEVRLKIDDKIDKDNIKHVIMDFSSITFMDSSGIGVVIGRYKKLQLKKGSLVITSLTNNVKRIFNLSGMFKIISTFDSLDEAVSNI